jgi:hypothetical protein
MDNKSMTYFYYNNYKFYLIFSIHVRARVRVPIDIRVHACHSIRVL